MTRKKKKGYTPISDTVINPDGSVTISINTGIDASVLSEGWKDRGLTISSRPLNVSAQSDWIEVDSEIMDIIGGDTALIPEYRIARGAVGPSGVMYMSGPGATWVTHHINQADPTQPPEKYWSGGTNSDRDGESVDVFVDEDVMFIGIANEDEHTIRDISRDEAVKLIGLLQEGLTKANEWDRYKKFRKVSEAEDSSKAEDTEQDPNIY